MEIIIGSTQPMGWKKENRPKPGAKNVEAKVLAVREPRQRRGPVPRDGQKRKSRQHVNDPLNGQVLILMVPDKRMLPQGLEEGKYKVSLQFLPKGKG